MHERIFKICLFDLYIMSLVCIEASKESDCLMLIFRVFATVMSSVVMLTTILLAQFLNISRGLCIEAVLLILAEMF